MGSSGQILLASTDAITATNNAGASDYEVDFGQNVSQCVATATIADFSQRLVPQSGEILLTDGADAEKIYVDTRTSAGADAGANRPFVIAVFC